MKDLHKKYCTETYDENGIIKTFDIHCPENFNFGFDVIDTIGIAEPNRRAMVWVNEQGEEHIFTYADLMKKSNQVANMLLENGVKKGDKLLCILKRHYQFWFLNIAMCKIGAVLIPATNQLMVKDLVYRFGAAGVKHVIATADGEVTNHVEESMEQYDKIEKRFIVRGEKDGWISFDKELEKYPETLDRPNCKASDDMLLYFTSGTTGYPKMVVHDQYYSLAHIGTAKHWHNLTDKSVHLTISETGWAKSMWGKMYGQFFMAAAIFVFDFDRFVPSDMLKKVQDYKITSLCAPPTMFRFFLMEGLENYDLSSLEYATIAGEALNPEIFKKFYEFTGLKLMEGFGQTETVLQIANTPGMEPRPGSMGKPMPLFNVDIVDDDGNSCKPGEVGEIVIRTTGRDQIGMFKGYYNDEEATKKSWHGGLYHTFDTAWRDEDGYFWYVGRTDDLIKASGYRIGPFEIESVMMEHPSVLEVAVTGSPDPIRGQVVKATVVLTKEYKDKAGDALIKELQDYVKHATAPYKYPRIVEFVDELPKTISGKIRRVEIREKGES